MGSAKKLALLDENGRPLDPRIVQALTGLLPRFQRQFPTLNDDVTIVQVFEEAGRRIAAQEQKRGPIERLHGYAWVAVRRVATSLLRRGRVRLSQSTLEPESSATALASTHTTTGTPEQVETEILIRELLGRLTPEERRVCRWKNAGFSSKEIGERLGTSALAVDTIYSRAKAKLRRSIGIAERSSENEFENR